MALGLVVGLGCNCRKTWICKYCQLASIEQQTQNSKLKLIDPIEKSSPRVILIEIDDDQAQNVVENHVGRDRQWDLLDIEFGPKVLGVEHTRPPNPPRKQGPFTIPPHKFCPGTMDWCPI